MGGDTTGHGSGNTGCFTEASAIFYTFTATRDYTAVFEFYPNYDGYFTVSSGSCGSISCIGDGYPIQFSVSSGTTYYIIVSSLALDGSDFGTFTINYYILDNCLECDDSNPCTIDDCYVFYTEESTNTYCFHEDVDCDDHDICTNDSCNGETGECIHESVICNDYDSSTIDTCDRLRGCQFIPNICSDDDDNVCTISILNLETGECENGQTLECDDGNPCTEDYCDSMRGCQITWKDCDDELRCTNDYCDTDSGECINEEKDCNSENPGTYCSEELFGECVENLI